MPIADCLFQTTCCSSIIAAHVLHRAVGLQSDERERSRRKRMALLSASPASPLLLSKQLNRIITHKSPDYSKLKLRALISWGFSQASAGKSFEATRLQCSYASSSSSMSPSETSKSVWIWSEDRQVLTAAVERGWSTFIFSPHNRELADEWSSIAVIRPLFIKEDGFFDEEGRLMATVVEVSNPQQLEQLQPANASADNVVVDLQDWQIIPAENIVAAFQGSQKTVFAVSKTPIEAQIFLEALEHGLGGVVLKVGDPEAVFQLKDYFDRRNEASNLLHLTKATVTQVHVAGMGDRVCVDLCSLMRPGEGLLVGSYARGLFLIHSECLESNYIASRPFRVNAGPVHAYVAVPGGKTSYLSELRAGKEVIVVDQEGRQRTAIVGRVKIETRQLILVQAKRDSDEQTLYSILLQNAETVALVCPGRGNEKKAIPVTSLKVGDEVFLRLQGEARHTGIEIQEFIVEK